MSVRRFYGPKPTGPRRGRMFRPVILAGLLAVICWAFMSNNQRRLDTLIAEGLFSDDTKTVSSEQRDQVVGYLKVFKKEFGIPLEVHVRKNPPALNANDASRMIIDIVPSQGRAYLHLPPLVRHAVGEAFIRDMERSFAQDFAAGDWRVSLVPAVLALRNKLAEVTR